MIEEYDGTAVVDTAGERLGTVERSYVDARGQVRFIDVKLRGLRSKHRLIPMEIVERTDDALTVSFGKDVVEGSPDASSAGDTLEEATLDKVRAYYERHRQAITPAVAEPAAIPVDEAETTGISHAVSSDHEEGIGGTVRDAVEQIREKLPGSSNAESGQPGDHDIGRVRDLGDVIEIPIVEEEIVKRPVVKEVLRIRKPSIAERQRVTGEVRKEHVDIIPEGDVPIHGEIEETQP